MKQIIQSYRTGEMELTEVPRPQVSPGMVLVETKASVVSAGTEKMLVSLAKMSLIGKARARPDLVRKTLAAARKEGIRSTLEKVRSRLESPVPLGYSCSGIVRELGEGVEGLTVGDRVACGGAGYANHAEFNVIPRNLCVPIPDSGTRESPMAFEEAAFSTIGAIALQGVRQARLTLGESVCVVGLGLLGQITVQLCKASGCRVLGADIDDGRISLAADFGAESAVRSESLSREAARFSGGVGMDAVIITAAASGSDLVALAGEISRLKGRVVVVGLVGLDIPRDVYYKKELEVRLSMSYGPGRYDVEYEERGHDYPLPYVRWTEQRNMSAFLGLCVQGRLDVRSLITHRYPFDQSLSAYRLITQGEEPSLGVVLEYDAGPQPRRIPVISKAGRKMEGPVGIGLIGAGNFANSVLLPKLSRMSQVRFRGVTTGRGMTAKAVAERFGFDYCAETATEIIDDDQIRAVFVVTRHDLHGPLVEKCLAAGKHVFVEKPLCIHASQLASIENILKDSASSSAHPVLMVGFNRRFSPMVRKIKDGLSRRASPLVGSYRVNAGLIPKDSWVQDPLQGGGRIIGEACHMVDTLRFLTGSSVKTVQAGCVRSGRTEDTDRDTVSITLTYADGSLGDILYYALGSPAVPKERLDVSADGSSWELNHFRELATYRGTRSERTKETQDKGHEEEVRAFLASVAGETPPPIPLMEIFETTRVSFAVHEALDTGRMIHMDEWSPEETSDMGDSNGETP